MSKSLKGPNIAINALAQILSIGGESLLWTSESDYPITTRSLPHFTVRNWPKETADGRPIHPLYEISGQMRGIAPEPLSIDDYGADALTLGRYLLLYDLFISTLNRECGVFKRPTNQPRVFDLYLLIRFPGEWIGLKTQVVEK